MKSRPATVAGYLRSLTSSRRADISAVRKVIRRNLPKGYAETVQYGMISYVVPLRLYPAGYLGNPKIPVCYAALAAQKNHISVYLMNIYGDKLADRWFRKAYKDSGKKLAMGKSCVRFRKPEDAALEVIGQAIARTPVREFIRTYERSRKR